MTSNKTNSAPQSALRSRDSSPKALLLVDPTAPAPLPTSVFEQAGLAVALARDLETADRILPHTRPAVIFAHLSLNGQPSRDLVERAAALKPKPVIVIVATNDEINAAAEVMRAGADDCLFWPFSETRLANTIVKALDAQATPARDQAPASAAVPGSPAPNGFDPFHGTSPRMRAVLTHVDALARSDVPVALSGPAGSGKALLARRLHAKSTRAKAAFVQMDCAALPPEGIETALFGPQGALARATRGTLYLANIAQCPPSVQTALLRHLDARHGDADLRLVVSVETIFDDAARASPLCQRLCMAPVLVPGLSDRRDDVGPLAEAIVRGAAPGTAFDADALAWLSTRDWPGNLDQLRAVVLTARRHARGQRVTKAIARSAYGRHALPGPDPDTAPGVSSLIGKTLDEIEEIVIEATIRAEGGSLPRAASVLGVSPSTLYRKRAAWARDRGS